MCKHLLIATDGSQASAKALAQGLALAKASAIQVTVVTVTEPWTERAYATMPTLHDWFMRRPRLAMRPLSSRTSNRNLDSRPAIPCRGRHEVTGANRLRHAALGKGGRRCAITEHHTPGLRIDHPPLRVRERLPPENHQAAEMMGLIPAWTFSRLLSAQSHSLEPVASIFSWKAQLPTQPLGAPILQPFFPSAARIRAAIDPYQCARQRTRQFERDNLNVEARANSLICKARCRARKESRHALSHHNHP